uniref:ZP domain-containing protein n=1 Tax=Haemonchus contortus TaxID=6289 RepID=A0A7I4YZS4_HAECO
MSRQRLVPPEGMILSTVLVISFHPLFITKADKMFTVRCVYKELSQTITARLQVSMLPSEQLPTGSASPVCSYTIRRDSLDGEILTYAKVGDQVVHRWNCDTDEFGILVHSCVVEDGQGQKELIVDEQGCHTDRLLLGDPTYVAALNMAYREASIFKFADRISVRFRCEIRLCLKFDGGCEGITPPLCNSDSDPPKNVSKRDLHNNTAVIEKRPVPDIDADLLSQTVVVFDEDFDYGRSRSEAHGSLSLPQSICLGFHTFAWASAAVVAGIILTLSVVVIQYKSVFR